MVAPGRNVTVFDSNVLHALSGLADGAALEDAEAIYLRWSARNRLKAERAASGWATMAPRLRFMAEAACSAFPDGDAEEVVRFLRTRHERSFFPDGREV